MARLILDTCVLVAGGRGRVDVESLADTDDVAVPAVVVAEHHAAGSLIPTEPATGAACMISSSPRPHEPPAASCSPPTNAPASATCPM